jgi:hypothetical protein
MNPNETGCELFIGELKKCGCNGSKMATSKNSILLALLLDDVLSAGQGFMKAWNNMFVGTDANTL